MNDRQSRRLKWPEMLAWCMASSALVVQIRQILDRSANNTLWVHIPYILSFLGAVLVFAYSAYHSVRKRRLAWALLALATFIATVVAAIGLGTRLHFLDYSIFAPAQAGMIFLEYGLVLVAGGAFLPRRLSLLGNLSSVILDSIIVGCVFFLFSQVVLPRLFPWPLTYEASGMRYFLALDAGVILGFGLLFIRYHKQDGSVLLGMLFIALVCHLFADSFYLILAWLPGSSFALTDIAMPLYMLRNAVCALGIYWSVQQPLKSILAGQLMPYFEWMAWTRISRVCLLGVALALAFFVPGAYAATFVLILILATLRELLSTYQEHGLLVNLHAVTLQEQQTNAELTKANAQIQAEVATTDQFLIRLAHDLGSPVQGLLTIVSSDTAWRADQRHLQALAAKQVALLRTFVEQARTYLQARTFSLQKSSLALLPLCATAVEAVTLWAQPRGVQIVPDFSAEALTVWGDEAALRRILDNLLTNAVRISPAGEEVLLSVTTPTPDQVQIAVQDHGPGIPPDRQVYLFKPYTALQRLDGQEFPSPTGTGLGLGLAIVKELTTALGGTCGVKSAPGAGATFYVRLPAKPASVSTGEGGLHAKDTHRG